MSYAERFASSLCRGRLFALGATLGLAFTVAVIGGCSNEIISTNETATETATVTEQENSKDSDKNSAASPDTARLIVTLKTADTDYTIKRLTAKFPKVKIVRSMPAFSQLVVELPSTQVDALTAEPFILSVATDKRVGTLKSKP